jgi:hypothetical protein
VIRAARLALISALTIVVFSGCSGNAGSVDAGPCRLISREAVVAALGSPVEAGELRDPIRPEPGLAMCGYRTFTRFGEIVVAEQRPGQGAFAASRTKAKRDTGAVPGYRALEWPGDQAFASGGGVSVLKGNTFLVVFAQHSFPDFEGIAQRLADRAASQIR